MSKIKKLILTAVIALLVLTPVTLHAVNVTINSQRVNFTDQAPTIIDGRTLVPVRGVFEMLGFDVDWDAAAQQVTLTRATDVVIITIGSAVFTANGTNHTLDVPAQIIGGRTMLPIRAVLESVGYYVGWDEATGTVMISSEPIAAQDEPVQPTEEVPAYITIRGRQFSTDEITLILHSFDFDSSLTNEDIEPLRYMTNLTMLQLPFTTLGYHYQITDITPLAGLTNLVHLNLSGTRITDLTPLAGLVNLTSLSLVWHHAYDTYNNLIIDWAPVAHVEHVLGRPQQ